MFSIFNIKNKSNTTNILVNQNDKSHESIVTVEPVEAETSATTSEMLNDLGDLSSGPAQPKTKFPLTKSGEQKRSFNESYYKKHEWVEYSISSDAIFCFACCIFGTDSV